MAVLYSETIKFMCSASTAGGLINRNGAAFSSLKKYAAPFFNTAFGGTEDKEARLPVSVRSDLLRCGIVCNICGKKGLLVVPDSIFKQLLRDTGQVCGSIAVTNKQMLA